MARYRAVVCTYSQAVNGIRSSSPWRTGGGLWGEAMEGLAQSCDRACESLTVIGFDVFRS